MAAEVKDIDTGGVDVSRIRLPRRYIYDGKAIPGLKPLQIATRDQIRSKVTQGEYRFEAVRCPVCGGSDFELLSTKDFYGLFMPVAICKDCGLVQANPRMDERSYDEFYSYEYQRIHKGTDAPRQEFFDAQYSRGKVIYEYLATSGFEVTGIFVLEVGCGAGGITKCFKDRGNSVLGIDLGEEYLDFGRREHGIDLRYGKLGDVEFKQVPDLVIYSHVVEHLLYPAEELRLLSDLIGEETVIYIEVPGIRNIRKSSHKDFLRYLSIAHVYYFTLTTMANLLTVNGFTIYRGDELIRVIARKEPEQTRIELSDDYDDTIAFLLRTERLRRYFPAYRLRNFTRRGVSSALKKARLYPVVYPLYSRLKRPKS